MTLGAEEDNMLLYREGEPIDCDEDSTIAVMFGMAPLAVAITFTRPEGDTVTWSKQS